MARFVERGPPSEPARGIQLPHPSKGTSASSALQPAPKASTTNNGRVPAQTAIANTALRQKK